MRKYFFLQFFLFWTLSIYTQVPQFLNYQAVVRDGDNLVINELVNVTVSLTQNDDIIYTEEHFGLNTGSLGKINFRLGEGTNPNSDFSSIQWGLGGISAGVTLNGENIGTIKLAAVPYALYAVNSGDKHWNKSDSTENAIYYSKGKVGVGIDSPINTLHISGLTRFSHPSSSTQLRMQILAPNLDAQIASYSENNDRLWILNMGDRSHNNRFGLYSQTTNKYEFIIDPTGKVGINGFQENSRFYIRGLEDEFTLRLRQGRGGVDNGIYMDSPGSSLSGRIFLENDVLSIGRGGGNFTKVINVIGGRVGINTTAPQNELHVEGRTRTKTLQITGGSDINEDFDSKSPLEAGDVVIIDTKNEGQLCRSTNAYDKKVAGVISGANGINSGLSLSQEGILDGEYPLAMLGRVYVKVTGPVIVGDMLTTSTKPGYAMAVRDYEKARGAVIGKAMMSNEKGDGMVLVLIQSQ